MSIGRAADTQPQMDVVIVNWNTGDCLHNCLSSLSVAGAGISVGRSVVVDNASSDGSIEHLPDLPHLVVVRNSQNVGFAAACNQGARLGSAPYVLFLNPDTLLLPDTLRSVLAFMESPDGTPYGICGGSVLQADGTPGLSASRFPTLANVVMSTPRLERLVPSWVPPRHMAANELAASQPVDQVIGAFFVVRRSLFDRLEGFDERYFLYYEEVDFCYRAASVGASTYLLSDAKLYHIGNVSAKRSGGLALFQSVRSRTVYAIRHWARRDVFALVAFTLMLELPARVLRAMFRFDASETAAVGRAFGHYLAFILRTVRHRGLIPDMPPNGSHAAARSGRVGVLGGSMTRTSNSSTQGRISRLPFARPTIGEDEIAEVVSALRSGWITTGPRTKLFEEQFGAEVGADAALALSSGTAAMHLALVAMDIGPGHRVFTSPMTFCSTAHVIEHVGARPVLVDVEPQTLNLDPAALSAAVAEPAAERPAAVMPVHYGGHPCNMTAIVDVARDAGLCVVEDAAHAFGARYRGSPVGQTLEGLVGHAVCFSLYATKNITTGEGGVLASSTGLVDVAREWSLHGMNRDAWRRYAG